MDELVKAAKKIFEQELPPAYLQRSEEEKQLLKKINTKNQEYCRTMQEWEELDDLITDLMNEAEKNGFTAGFAYALTFMEKVYGLEDLNVIFSSEQ